jgi:hypothetical protein
VDQVAEEIGRQRTEAGIAKVLLVAWSRKPVPVKAKPYPALADLSPETVAKFLGKIDKRGPGECWEWVGGARDGRGYGAFCCAGRILIATRLAWVIEHGSVPVDKHVLHTCDNPPCCNPAHHYLGTHRDNVRDRTARRRMPPRRGPDNHNAKLTDAQAQEIIRRRLAGESSGALSREFGIAQPSVCAMALGKRYVAAYEAVIDSQRRESA